MINSIGEFLAEVNAYFRGGLGNEKIESLLAKKLATVKPGNLQRLFDKLIETHPANFSPDVKALTEAIQLAGIVVIDHSDKTLVCASCGASFASSGVCPVCKYSGTDDGDPRAYFAWYQDFIAGRVPRPDIGSILANLASKTRVLP